jgi:hypothetical protein
MIDQVIALQIGALANVIKRIHKSDLTPDELEAIEAILGQIPTRFDYRLFEQLEAIIQMTIAYPMGLNMLLGRTAPPTTEQINEMILMFTPAGADLGVRVDAGDVLPRAERLIYTEQSFSVIIAETGGWRHINEVARGYMKLYPNTWNIVADHARWVKTKITRTDGSSLRKVADANGCSIETVRNTINSFPLELARAIIASPLDGELDLRSIDEYPAI